MDTKSSIAGSEVSGPEHGKDNMFENKWCVLIKDNKMKSRNLRFLNSLEKVVLKQLLWALKNMIKFFL